MPSALDSLKAMAFGGIAFPYLNYRVSGGLRKKVHEYPHSPGGATEKLGRKLYEVSGSAEFLANATVARYQGLWPDALSTLRRLWEQGSTQDLHVPTIGTFKAVCDSWVEDVSNVRRSSVRVDFVFTEDQDQAFLVNALVDVDRSGLKTQLQDFQIAIEEKDCSSKLFDGIVESADAILAAKQELLSYPGRVGQDVAAKIDTLVTLCNRADREVRQLELIPFQTVRDALHDLWLSATTLQKDSETRLAQLRLYVTPLTMTINAVARAVGVENPADVMVLNAIPDPLSIPAGTSLRYYAQAA